MTLRSRLASCAVIGAGLGILAGCHKSEPPLPPAQPHYVIGSGWQGDGAWFYPRERFSDHETGLAVRLALPRGAPMADGVSYDPDAMVGAHQTLQLPSIVTVRDLDNGRTVRIRLDGRGPTDPGRLVAVSPRVAALLGMGPGPARVAIDEDEPASRAFAESSPDAPHLSIASAPVGGVSEQPLDDLGHAAGAAHQSGNNIAHWQPQGLDLTPLPAVYTQAWVAPGSLWVEIGRFSGRGAARGVAARCSGDVSRAAESGAGLDWVVRSGPFADVRQADEALQAAFSCGMPGARITAD
ncbi:septal ring lytic transglycosylase RlpA family protein [Tanticharoenia sakaeratensis]|uniref:Rare lipoprotein A n=1 Tax=Tanticharoenia sakaeratensis NBRC 103193 TaxID=1231623 RepID=A0A0D6MNG5_9PROT|nr:SPOR domain-containing protein [Tanticharoenia sakaeratensis]GAN54945.1 rare lipoprotein A [Tanticharoenia sakaeratensis NBRC 103193]GBQ22545.1 lipoprotein [Tanticharoenia sakaeratensis NBRC 103193]